MSVDEKKKEKEILPGASQQPRPSQPMNQTMNLSLREKRWPFQGQYKLPRGMQVHMQLRR